MFFVYTVHRVMVVLRVMWGTSVFECDRVMWFMTVCGHGLTIDWLNVCCISSYLHFEAFSLPCVDKYTMICRFSKNIFYLHSHIVSFFYVCHVSEYLFWYYSVYFVNICAVKSHSFDAAVYLICSVAQRNVYFSPK